MRDHYTSNPEQWTGFQIYAGVGIHHLCPLVLRSCQIASALAISNCYAAIVVYSRCIRPKRGRRQYSHEIGETWVKEKRETAHKRIETCVTCQDSSREKRRDGRAATIGIGASNLRGLHSRCMVRCSEQSLFDHGHGTISGDGPVRLATRRCIRQISMRVIGAHGVSAAARRAVMRRGCGNGR